MEGSYALGCYPAAIDSKGSAISFAILMSCYDGMNGIRKINYKKAQKIFDFICSNVRLPDVKTDGMERVEALVSGLIGGLNAKEKEVCDG